MENSYSLISFIIGLAYLIGVFAGLWKVFEKAGYDAWKALIPFYNSYCLCEIVYGKGIYFLGYLIPYINGIFAIFTFYHLSKTFGKSIGFFMGLFLLPCVFLPLLGFGDDQYQGPSTLSF